MSDIDAFSIVTLVFFLLSTFFVIQPLSFHVPFPVVKRVRITIGLMTAPIIAIIVLWASQCITATQIRDGIVGTDGIKPYNILILFISLAYLAITLDASGVLKAAAYWVSNQGGSNTRKLYFYFYLLLTCVSMVVGNDPVILSGTAFLVYYTQATKLNPVAWLIAEFAAANTASMVLFVGNPTNVVICEGFSVNNAAFTAYTILPFIACNVTCYVALAFQFRHPKHLPPSFAVKGPLNPRDALSDPVSAIFGGVLLLICLALVIVLSFFHVDVWKVVLPFAVAKFIFDIAWDQHQFKKRLDNPTSSSDPQLPPDDDETKMQNQLVRGLSMPDIESALGSNIESVLGSEKIAVSPKQSTLAGSEDSEVVKDSNASNKSKEAGVCPKRNDSAGSDESKGSDGSKGSDESKDSKESGDSTKPLVRKVTTKSSNDSKDSNNTVTTSIPNTPRLFAAQRDKFDALFRSLSKRFPIFFTALPRLPFGLIPFAFSQFILIEGLAHQGWIDIFAGWLIKATHGQIIPTIWVVGVLGVILCNIAGTNIGATILLTKVVRAAPGFPVASARAAAIALAVASNIGAVSFTFSASLAGLLWKSILKDKNIVIKQSKFAFWNCLPIVVMTAVGLAVVTAEMSVLYKH